MIRPAPAPPGCAVRHGRFGGKGPRIHARRRSRKDPDRSLSRRLIGQDTASVGRGGHCLWEQRPPPNPVARTDHLRSTAGVSAVIESQPGRRLAAPSATWRSKGGAMPTLGEPGRHNAADPIRRRQRAAAREPEPVGRRSGGRGRRTLWSDKSGLVVRALRFLGVPFGAVNGAIRVLRR
jgi:hypothetical protein